MIVNEGQLIDELASDCVQDMGDIFWDHESAPDTGSYSDPVDVAVRAVKDTLQKLAKHRDSDTVYPSILRQEYATLVADAGDQATEQDLIQLLVSNADWTARGASTLAELARRHGTFVLRSALALAEALGVEDGEDGA